MKRMHRISLSLAVAASLAGGAALLHHRHAHPASSAASPNARALRFAIDLPRGREYAYDVAWSETSRVSLGDATGSQAIAGGVDLAAELTLRSLGKREGAFVVGVRLGKIAKRSLTVQGVDALADDATARATFEGREAFAEIEPTGEVRAVRFAKGDPAPFKDVVRGLVEKMSLHVLANGEDEWKAVERSAFGAADASYVVEDAGDAPRVLRTRDHYARINALPGRTLGKGDQELASNATIDLDPKGHVRGIDAHETLKVRATRDARATDLTNETRFAARLVAMRDLDTVVDVDLASLEVQRMDEAPAPPPEAARDMLDQRIAGLTAEQMRLDLATYAFTGALPGTDWVLRASGLLKKDPRLCLELAALFEETTMNARGRAQILDLLAGTGTPEAQGAMRVALASPHARQDGKYGLLLQRFSSITKPTRETIDFARSAYGASRGDDRWAAAYTLGSVASHAGQSGEAARARAIDAQLREDLAKAKEPEARRHLAAALGNAAQPESVAALAALAKDDDSSVRSAAAWALRDVATPEARDALLAFATDGEPAVAANAFDALRHQTLDASELARLAAATAQTPPRADGALLLLLSAHPEGGDAVRAAYDVLLARNDADLAMQGRIRHARAGVL